MVCWIDWPASCALRRSRPPDVDEFALIRRYFAQRPPPESSSAWLHTGIGDDAAVLDTSIADRWVLATDTLVAGRHFAESANPADMGWKALAVNLSDLAAMGATPRGFLLALTLPHADADWLTQFAEGLFALADEQDVTLIGGDTTRGPLSMTITAFGTCDTQPALLRSGAQPGDEVWVSGTLGDAALALHLGNAAPASLAQRLHRPQPRVEAGLAVAGQATAAIDISDGLAADLGHVADASHVGIRIHSERLPRSAEFAAHCPEALRMQCLLAGGDDYELAVCLPAGTAPPDTGCGWTRIGVVVKEPGITIHSAQGVVELAQSGFQHFSDS